MLTSNFIKKLPYLLRKTSDQQGANAAVGLLLKPGQEDYEILFVKRVERSSDPWSGQIAFPGGKHDPEDKTLKDTVIREIFEETGINLQENSFLGVLKATNSKPSRNIRILPFIAILKEGATIKLNENELDCYFWIPYKKIVNSKGVAEFSNRKVPAYILEEEIVWGVTYRILESLEKLLSY
ncbi:MAG: CoA pyrophosphatase [Candidatus Bathyarchaeota archaeon]|nr:CoA pyrophosphatase [Candidatus Bathyarchaeota archaeon]